MRYTRFACAVAMFAMSVPVVEAADLGSVVLLTGSNRLITLDLDTPGAAPTRAPRVQGLAVGEEVLGIDHRPANGRLYGVTSSGRVVAIKPSSGRVLGSVQLTGATLSGAAFGIDFNPVPDRLRLVTDAGQNLRINVDSGAATVDLPLNPGSPTVSAAAYTNAAPGASTTTLYVLDIASDRLLIQNPPNDGTLVPVGSLGVNATKVNGFDIRATDNLALAALKVDGQNGLYQINLSTGAASLVSTLADVRNVRGLSIPTPFTEIYAVSNRNKLLRFLPPAFVNAMPVPLLPALPGTRVRRIMGLGAGETLVGADFRPATGELVGLGSSGVAYTIDTATGAATSPITLIADAADSTDRNADYTALDGAEFGVDFNPVPDRLRTVSDTNKNLRSNVDTGATFSDLDLKWFAATAAAYTNSFGAPDPTRTTRLFGIDSVNDQLYLQSPPNNGTLTAVGALGFDVLAVNGFDIAGPDDTATPANVVALAALTPNPGVLTPIGQPTFLGTGLFRIDVGTGEARLIGPIGDGLTVSALALPITTTTPASDSLVFALLADGRTLICFERDTPEDVTTIGTIASGDLSATDRFIGIDFRPSDRLLYGVTNANEVFTLDLTTAAATLVATLAATTDPVLDPTPDFAGLVGSNFGLDFNPVPDRLRIVSDGAMNLRINVATGATITDGDINTVAAAPVVVAGAYTNNFPGGSTPGSGVAGSTRLYVLEATQNLLAVQDPPNLGVLTPVGPLGVDVPASGVSFDIAGGANGLAYASFDGDADGKTELYRINLMTGAATLIGDLGERGIAKVTGLSIRLR
ncbi:MAG: DUF4394 domain-containing protein [Panacagrimonas sp.]